MGCTLLQEKRAAHALIEVTNELTPELSRLAIMIGEAASAATTEANQVELKSAGDRCKILADNVQAWTRQAVENSVYWVEQSGTYKQRLSLVSRQ